jgi:hypothetical protein
VTITSCELAAALTVLSAARRFGLGRGTLGLFVGTGLTLIVVGVGRLDYHPLPPSAVVALAPGQTSASYGGMDLAPWLVAGAILVVTSLLIVVLLGRRQVARNRSDCRLQRQARRRRSDRPAPRSEWDPRSTCRPTSAASVDFGSEGVFLRWQPHRRVGAGRTPFLARRPAGPGFNARELDLPGMDGEPW